MILLQESTKYLASQSCGGAPSRQACRHTIAPAALPEAHDVFFLPQAPTVKICVSAGAPAATLKPILYSRGHSRGLVCASVVYFAPCCPLPRPRRPCPRPCPRPRHDRTCLIRCSLLSFLISAATAGGRTTVQTVSAAAKTLPTTPTRER